MAATLTSAYALAEPVRVEVRAQKMTDALNALAEQLKLQLIYDGKLVAGLQARAMSGRMEPAAALQGILEGSGLSFRFLNETTVTIEKAADTRGIRLLGPVRVEGMNARAVAGINGSTDPTATEGAKSYTSSALSIASKGPQSIKDTPQSVSVITQQRMQDQNIIDFESAMNEAPGVTTLSSGTYGAMYYSRGFLVDTFQIDGGAPLALVMGQMANGASVQANFNPVIDMAMYDHLEVLRGADGLFNGYGNPGGTVNLVRKRPLAEGQVTIEGQVGSWNHMRTVIDATGPLGFDGRLRGRGVTSYQDNEFFYDMASHNSTLTYGMLEFDVSADTLVSGGFSLSRVDGVPEIGGLPRYIDGDDLNLPRDTCLCLPWNRQSYETTELFAQVQQKLFGDWSVKLNLTRIEQDAEYKYARVSGAVFDAAGNGPTLNGQMANSGSVQEMADVTFSGSFDLFGLRQQITIGANYQQADNAGSQHWQLFSAFPAVNVFNFDPNASVYREPEATAVTKGYPGFGQTQWGTYANLNFTVLPRVHLATGVRYSYYEFDYLRESRCTFLYEPNCRNVGDVESSEIKRYSDHDLSWPPTYSLSYDLRPNVSVYGSYTDIYQSQADYLDHSLNPLGPVTGANIQAGVNIELSEGKLNATIGVYQIEQKNQASFLDYGAYEATQGLLPDGQRRCCYADDTDYVMVSQGVDLEVAGELLPGWQLAAGYSYNTNEYKGEDASSLRGRPLQSQQPEHLFKLSTSYRVSGARWFRPFTVGGSVHGQSKAYQAGESCLTYEIYEGDLYCTVSVPYEYTQGAYVIGRLHLGFDLTPQWQINLAVENVTDKRYYRTMGTATDGNRYGEPRSYLLVLRGTF